MKFDKIGIDELRLLADFLLQNRNDTQIIIDEFGKVSSNNGYGTFFLIPKNPIFKTFWVYEKENKLGAIGFGGPELGLKLEDIYSNYSKYAEEFSRYDNEYVYAFFENDSYTYMIKIFAKEPLFQEGKILKNIDIDSLEIWLRNV
jgi:hypothetical protein